jgi:hypothetical protein
MVNTRLFDGKEYSLEIYNGQALINRAFRFFTVVDCIGIPFEEVDFDFPGYASSYFRVFNERTGTMIKDLSMDQNGPYLIANFSVLDMTFADLGDYYYEIGYSNNGYEQVLRYGTLKVI